jgi:hypothetical protein
MLLSEAIDELRVQRRIIEAVAKGLSKKRRRRRRG